MKKFFPDFTHIGNPQDFPQHIICKYLFILLNLLPQIEEYIQMNTYNKNQHHLLF